MFRILLALALILTASGTAHAQKFFTKTGHVSFFSDTQMEDIKAYTHQGAVILNTQTGDVVFSVLMKGFQFEKALMQEHFNEKYVESDKFPKATFTGKITNLAAVKFTQNGTYNATVQGDMNLHGVSKNITTQGKVVVENGKIILKADFPLTIADYNIQIPAAVRDNIAKVVACNVDVTLLPMP
ncbi:MAG: YceI family protein [Bacteroidia bacterium]|nr:YceI family protein [Bacteroidia bacterium]